MRINHNIAALNTYRQLNAANNAQMKSMEKLASGLRINRAGDDAAGLAISEKMRAQVRGLDMAAKNSQDATSLIQTAEGALNETHAILQRMRELAVQASNGTNTDDDRNALHNELEQLKNEITRIGNQTEFNTQKLLDGSFGANVELDVTKSTIFKVPGVSSVTTSGGIKAGDYIISEDNGIYTAEATISGETITLKAKDLANDGSGTIQFEVWDTENDKGTGVIGLTVYVNAGYVKGSLDEADQNAIVVSGTEQNFQIGANKGQTIGLSIGDMRTDALGLTNTSINTYDNAQKAISEIDTAIKIVSGERSKLGAYQNRLEHTINNLNTSSENLTAAESRIRDVDMAKEMMEQTKNAILSQAAQAMLAQANQLPQGVLQLLR